jgi:Na+-transporting methylmalonyl-CoA/oxaloacetate decarboxylase gamma subunit
MMENMLQTSLVIVSVGIVVLLAVLSLLAGIVYLLTLTVKDKPADVAEVVEIATEPAVEMGQSQKVRAALIGVALARAEAEMALSAAPEISVETNSWRQFHRSRRLSQSLKPRRAS